MLLKNVFMYSNAKKKCYKTNVIYKKILKFDIHAASGYI